MYKESKYDKYWKSKGKYGEERIRRKKIRKEKRIAKMLYCPKCGGHINNVGPIQEKINPYYKEIDNTIILEKMCIHCYNTACQDI